MIALDIKDSKKEFRLSDHFTKIVEPAPVKPLLHQEAFAGYYSHLRSLQLHTCDADAFQNRHSYKIRCKRFIQGGYEISAKRVYERSEKSEVKKTADEIAQENLTRKIRRAKRRIRELVKNAGMQTMLTLTLKQSASHRVPLAHVKRAVQAFNQFLAREYGDFHYVAVPQLDEKAAFHVHEAVDLTNLDFALLNKKWNEFAKRYCGTTGACHVKFFKRHSKYVKRATLAGYMGTSNNPRFCMNSAAK